MAEPTPIRDAANEQEPLRVEELRDALADILDVCEGWTRPMTPTEKVESIKRIAHKAWENDRG